MLTILPVKVQKKFKKQQNTHQCIRTRSYFRKINGHKDGSVFYTGSCNNVYEPRGYPDNGCTEI